MINKQKQPEFSILMTHMETAVDVTCNVDSSFHMYHKSQLCRLNMFRGKIDANSSQSMTTSRNHRITDGHSFQYTLYHNGLARNESNVQASKIFNFLNRSFSQYFTQFQVIKLTDSIMCLTANQISF